MKNTYLWRSALAIFSLCFAHLANAQAWQEVDISQPFKLGYARIKFPDGKWLVHTSENDRTLLDSGRSDVARTAHEFILLDKKTGVHLGSGYIKASNAGGNFYTTWDCEKDKSFYLIEELSHEKYHHCGFASGFVNVEHLFEKDKAFEYQKAFLDKQGVLLNTNGHYVAVNASNGNGMQITLNLLFRSGFSPSLNASPKSKPPIAVGNKIAAWTDSLYSQAKSSVFSFFGNVTIPEVQFDLSPGEHSPKVALNAIKE
jgi:hypothetical protein